MDILDLAPWFSDKDLGAISEDDQVQKLYELYKEDFIDNPFQIDGKQIKIISKKSKIPGYSNYDETFVHLITREIRSVGLRIFEQKRANRIHWIKEILVNHPSDGIRYFKKRNEEGICQEFFWCYYNDFLVILKPIGASLLIVTGFSIDGMEEKLRYLNWFNDYKAGKSGC